MHNILCPFLFPLISYSWLFPQHTTPSPGMPEIRLLSSQAVRPTRDTQTTLGKGTMVSLSLSFYHYSVQPHCDIILCVFKLLTSNTYGYICVSFLANTLFSKLKVLGSLPLIEPNYCPKMWQWLGRIHWRQPSKQLFLGKFFHILKFEQLSLYKCSHIYFQGIPWYHLTLKIDSQCDSRT